MISRISIPVEPGTNLAPCSVGRIKGAGGFWRADRLFHPEGQCLREAQVLVGFGSDAADLRGRGGVPFCHKHDPLRIAEAVRVQRGTQASSRLQDVPTSVLERELARRRR